MTHSFDIIVIGGGSSGIASAVSAARSGCKTLLLERQPCIGGTGGYSGLTTLCGLYNGAGAFINDGFAREFAETIAEAPPLRMGRVWVLPYRPERFRQVAETLAASSENLEVRCGSILESVRMEAGRIVSVNGLSARVVIDCSGTAQVARMIGENCLETDETTQAPAVIFELNGVARELRGVSDVARVLLPLARAGLPPLSFQPNLDQHSVSIKFSGRPDQVGDVIRVLRREVEGFENCVASEGQFISRRRAGRMILGRYLLGEQDVLQGRKFEDAVARCSWPIEQWDERGQNRLRYLANESHYEIPSRCLQAARVINLFMAGKTISADVHAIASARVMGCCLATGAAAGNLAAAALASGCET